METEEAITTSQRAAQHVDGVPLRSASGRSPPETSKTFGQSFSLLQGCKVGILVKSNGHPIAFDSRGAGLDLLGLGGVATRHEAGTASPHTA